MKVIFCAKKTWMLCYNAFTAIYFCHTVLYLYSITKMPASVPHYEQSEIDSVKLALPWSAIW